MEKSKINFSKGLSDTIKFDSVPELASYYSTNILTRNWKGDVSDDFMSDRNDSFHGESPKDVLNSLKDGWTGGAERAQKLLSLIEGKLDVESNAYKVFPSVVGSTFNVGAYLSGNPMSMRMRKKTMENTNPIHIIIDLTVSAGTDHDEIMNRGIAALALARVLVQSRAVQLECICGLKTLGENLLMSFPVPTAPLDLSTASYLIGRPEVLRRIAFGLVAELGEERTGKGYNGHIPWLFNDHNWQMEKMLDEYAKMSGYGNDYLAVSGTVHSDKSDGDRNTPEDAAKWVIKNAERLLAAKGE
jgi:hypothetical protein